MNMIIRETILQIGAVVFALTALSLVLLVVLRYALWRTCFAPLPTETAWQPVLEDEAVTPLSAEAFYLLLYEQHPGCFTIAEARALHKVWQRHGTVIR